MGVIKAIRTITGTKLANSLRFAPIVAQTITFDSANLVLGVGIITNPEAVAITLQAADASSSITSAGSDLYVFTNGNTMTFNVRLTGNMNRYMWSIRKNTDGHPSATIQHLG